MKSRRVWERKRERKKEKQGQQEQRWRRVCTVCIWCHKVASSTVTSVDDETRRGTLRRGAANEAKRDETISLTVAAFNEGTAGGTERERERGWQTGAISRLDLPLILSVKSCNACACMQYTHTQSLSHTHTCIHKQCICVGVKFFNYFCSLNCISCKGSRQTHEEGGEDHKIRRLYQRLAIVIAACGDWDSDRQRWKGTDREKGQGYAREEGNEFAWNLLWSIALI